nr:MAG TPA: hypothetical protein [Caudoviricetes sp.]
MSKELKRQILKQGKKLYQRSKLYKKVFTCSPVHHILYFFIYYIFI